MRKKKEIQLEDCKWIQYQILQNWHHEYFMADSRKNY